MSAPLSRTAIAGPLAAVLALAILDQLVKRVFEGALEPHVPVPVWGPLHWFLTENRGVAFSQLSFLGANGLALLAVLILVFVVVLWWRTPPAHRLARIGFVLVAGGAVGNLIDRVMLGYVTDYVLLTWRGWSFAVFNLADAFITVGAIAVLVDELFGWGRRAPDAAGEAG